MDDRKRIFSGMRPTGRLHYGHMAGALINWVKLQNEYNCFWGIVDWHAMMSDYADPSKVKENCYEILLDWLAVGVDPEKSSIFIQSHVKQHAEIHLALSMITPLGWLQRCPTYKEQILNLQNKDLSTYAFLGYPVLMAGDILLYKSWGVPVGEDQSAHLELTREVARRFNSFYGDVFPEPETLLTPAAKMPGTDGRKMSKSYGNSLQIAEDMDTIWGKVRTMKTDPARGLPVLDPLRADGARYVQDSVANWLNDAAKSRPGWVQALCARWEVDSPDSDATRRIVRRALRSVPCAV